MQKKIFIEGMTCGHCVGHVKRGLEEVTGVNEVKVDLEEKNAVVDLQEIVTEESLKSAIEEAGYKVVKIESI
ncbi:Heavy metal transport/detoxification protein [Alkaliphilus metalliredigens QYMF]|uniref:Heavy metal transport/detoxification protein n=1 Tax=Alkaliphilus metalliredigens (strain QYMF) TaxID=293826 RepID=A6TJC0_ALKMQ|nr:heavy metal-associated domain-containing protein [Alkaliphilus metalliredigens]ABR46288.1 Heavy metal transport/detoxification protein [Alkaliphilus metalliredigens QYMF]